MNKIKNSLDDKIFISTVSLVFLRYYSKFKKKLIKELEISKISFRVLDELNLLPKIDLGPGISAAGQPTYVTNCENSIKKLEEMDIVNKDNSNLILTDYGIEILEILINQFPENTTFNLLELIDKTIVEFKKKSTAQAKELKKEHKLLHDQLKKIGSQMDQHFPDYLNKFQKQLLCFIYNSKNGEITTEGYNKFTKFMKLKCHKNSPYKTLKILEGKGFIKNYGEGRICYKLTKLGRVQARWYAGREIS